MDDEARTRLQEVVDNGEVSPHIKRRCAAILLVREGHATSEIARRMDTSSSQISVWKRRFADLGYEGLVSTRNRAASRRAAGQSASDGRGRERRRGAVAQVKLTPEQRQELLRWTRSPYAENWKAQRARAVLKADEGLTASRIGSHIMMTGGQVQNWCRRYLDEGAPGLRDRPRAGRPARDLTELVSRITQLVEAGPPSGSQRWTGSLLAEELGEPDHMVRKALKQADIVLPFTRRRVRRPAA